MDFDPDFEFDAPRWFDFTNDEGEFSFSDSWFEDNHPLHEPKKQQQKNTSGKSLFTKHESKSGPGRIAHTKPGQTNKLKGKKSLGVKTVRTKRGEHGPNTFREQKEKCCSVKGKPSVRGDSVEQSPGGEDHTEQEGGRAITGEFRCGPNFTFNPPWTGSPSITGNVNSESPCQEDNKQEVTGQIKENSTQHVQSEPSFSRPPVSPAKTVSGIAQKRPLGGTKRRLLPAIPLQKKKPEINISHSITSTSKGHKIRPGRMFPDQSSAETTAVPDGACTYNSGNSEARISEQSEDLSTSPSGLQQSGSFPCPNKLSTLGPGKKVELSSFRNITQSAKQPLLSPEQGEMSVEKMLKMHNQKILATKCKYDENGRKTWSANPTFCPAPDKDTKRTRRAKQKGMTVSKRPSSNASTSTAPSKKLAQCSEGVNPLTTNKQEKEAGVPVSTPTQNLLIQSNESVSVAVRKGNRCLGRGESQAVVNSTKIQTKQASVAKLSHPDVSSKHVITGQKRAGSRTEGTRAAAKQKRRSCMPSIGLNSNNVVHQNQEQVGKCYTKQKRRSCIAGIQKSGVSDAEKELEEIIQRHNSQIMAKKS